MALRWCISKNDNKKEKNNLIVKTTTLVTSAAIFVVVAATAGTTIMGINWSADAFVIPGLGGRTDSKAPSVVTGDNIYIA